VRQLFCILVALQVAAGTNAMAGVIPWSERQREPGPVEPGDSVALFVGIREFDKDLTLTKVRYAVDDAIDLAHAFSFNRNTRLVDPKRVILALNGEPQNPESARYLKDLIAAGAAVKSANHTDILMHLENQARAVGQNGILIVGFATHGVNDDGIQHLLAADSLLQHLGTTISEVDVREIVSRARVRRAFILLDACRRQLTSDTRSGQPDPRSAAAMMRKLANIEGTVVFAAAAAGNYAYDDDVRRNGVFSAAVIDGLQCAAPTDDNGFVTVDTLSTYVDNHVLQWLRKHQRHEGSRATQLFCEGKSKTMPLSACASAH
jgi:hypothetical protein